MLTLNNLISSIFRLRIENFIILICAGLILLVGNMIHYLYKHFDPINDQQISSVYEYIASGIILLGWSIVLIMLLSYFSYGNRSTILRLLSICTVFMLMTCNLLRIQDSDIDKNILRIVEILGWLMFAFLISVNKSLTTVFMSLVAVVIMYTGEMSLRNQRELCLVDGPGYLLVCTSWITMAFILVKDRKLMV